MDFDFDFENEIIVETQYGAGSNHYLERLRVFKDAGHELKLIFDVWTLDKTFGFEGDMVKYNADIVSEVEFTEPDPDNGIRKIIVRTKKIYYLDPDFDRKDEDIVKEEDIDTKVYWYNGEIFTDAKPLKEFSEMSNDELGEWLSGMEDIDIDWEYLQTCNRYFWEEADLNNDGIEEEIGIFFQWKGEGWWSDDIGYVICIFDQDHNIVYGREAVDYQAVDDLRVRDIDNDGFNEVIVSAGKTEFVEARELVYGWEDGEYRLIDDER